MRLRNRLIAVAVAAAALAISGCGGGDDSTESTPAVTTTPATTALTKEELIAQGDAICGEVNAAIGAISASSTEAGGSVAQAASLYIGMVESLKQLGIPAEADGYSELSSAADQLSQAEGEVKLAAERDDAPSLTTAESNAASALASFQAAAQTYGFEDCGSGPSAPVTSGSTEEPSEEEATESIEEEVAPEEIEPTPETGGAGSVEAGGGAETGGGGEAEGGGESSGGIGPG